MIKITDGRKWTKAQLAEVRLAAVEMVNSGMSHEDVAGEVGVHRPTVTKWVRLARENGLEGLAQIKTRGRRSGSGRVSAKQAAAVVNMIVDRHPDQLKLPFVLWTAAAVGTLIFQKFGIQLADRTVRTYLKKWGFTPQRPARVAREKDPVATEHWVRNYWPRVRKQAKARNAVVAFVDETGLKSDEVAGRSWAPKGQTPAIPVSGTRRSLNVIVAITPAGENVFYAFRGGFNSALFIEFLDRLDRHCGLRPIDIVLDNHSAHKSKLVRQWLESKEGRLQLIYLPPYSPELNPVELLNNDLKTNWIRVLRPSGQEELEMMTNGFFEDLTKMPARVTSYFQAQTTKYTLE